jgi:diacylglycerol kinase family enzyme
MAAYIGGAFAKLPRVTSVRHRVIVDGVVHDVRAAMVLIANCGELFPPFVKIHHEVNPDDGWLDVVALRADGAIDGVASFLELVLGSKEGSPRVWFGRGRNIRVETVEAPGRAVQLDGEVVGTTPLEARVLPHALTMLVAPGTASNGRGRGGGGQ